MGATGLGYIDDAIRNRTQFYDRLLKSDGHTGMALSLLRSYLLCTAVYGFVMGSFNGLGSADGWKFALASAIKVPMLFLLTTLIILPAIYVSNIVLGMTLRFTQTLTLFLSAMTITSFMLVACAPILLFFMLCTDSYSFIKLFNVVIFAISGVYGLKFLLGGIQHLKLFEGSSGMTLRLWLLAWALVGAQMAWILRPFIGAQDIPFTLFREQESNFYLNVLQTIGNLLGA